MSDFSRSLYTEHIENCTFLYQQRLKLYDNPETTWLRIGEFEDRFEANIDALVDSGDTAADICS